MISNGSNLQIGVVNSIMFVIFFSTYLIRDQHTEP